MDIQGYNRDAWDKEVEHGNQWTVPVGPEVTEAARQAAHMPTLMATRAIKP
jgi:hypothetical protein